MDSMFMIHRLCVKLGDLVKLSWTMHSQLEVEAPWQTLVMLVVTKTTPSFFAGRACVEVLLVLMGFHSERKLSITSVISFYVNWIPSLVSGFLCKTYFRELFSCVGLRKVFLVSYSTTPAKSCLVLNGVERMHDRSA